MGKLYFPLAIALLLSATTNAQLPSCSSIGINVVFVVDASASVSAPNFNLERLVVRNLAQRFGQNYNSMALIQFSSAAKVEFKCGSSPNFQSFDSNLNAVIPVLGGTCINCGLVAAETEISSCIQNNTIIFLITDGSSNIQITQVTQTASRLRQKGFTIYAYGIGDSVVDSELLDITGSSSMFEKVQWADIAVANFDSLYSRVTSKVCSTTAGPVISQWSTFGSCSASCFLAGQPNSATQTRTRTCTGSCTGVILVETQNCNTNIQCDLLSQWSNWGLCSATCRDGATNPQQTRTRTCQNSNNQCGGVSLTETQSCNTQSCTTGPVISQWSTFGSCSASCFLAGQPNSATQTRTRTCTGSCTGVILVETQNCNTNIQCDLLSQWSDWGLCSATCRDGATNPQQTRTRTCQNSNNQCGGVSLTETQSCNTQSCTTGPVISQWSTFGSCSASCFLAGQPNSATQTRTRTCTGSCTGVILVETQNCNTNIQCDLLSQWSDWGLCSATCRDGATNPQQTRTRTCQNSNNQCGGVSLTETQSCNTQSCTTGPVISQWSTFGSCSASCFLAGQPNSATQTRTRTCTGSCTGVILVETQNCNTNIQCDLLSQWSDWGLCSATCRDGATNPQQTRTRTCQNSNNQCGGVSLTETQSCNTQSCTTGPVISQWSTFGSCSASCFLAGQPNSATQTRTRTCTGSCTGVILVETQNCNTNIQCDLLSQWSDWGLCSATCRDGATNPQQTRTRTCQNSNNQCGGVSLTETQSCNTQSCTTGPVISQWSTFGSCSASCFLAGQPNSATQTRTRTCTGSCTGVILVETQNCNTNIQCDLLSQWSDWGLCSATCRDGATNPQQTRTRTCQNSNNQCGGVSLTETQSCNTQSCTTGPTLGPWSAFSACSATCYFQGDAVPTQTRTRTCSGTCTGLSTVETNQCNVGNICNLLSEWGTWASCSASCTVDSNNPPQRSRTRTCSFSVNNCNNAQVVQSQICNTQLCTGALRCSNANLSYVIVMDSSSSVSTGQPDVPNSDEWSQEKAFVKHFGQEIGIETNKNVRVAIVNFGQEAEIVATCEDPRTQNLQQFNSLIDNLPRKLGGTAIHDALTKSRQLYTSGGCGRQNEIRIILFLTDGYENIDFDVPKQIALEEQVRAEATIFIGAIGPETRESELLRILNGRRDLLVQTNNFQDLEGLDTKFIVPVILSQTNCLIDGVWGQWGNWGGCSITCGATGTRQRSRTCDNPTTFTAPVTCPIGSSNDIGSCFDGDCQGTLSQWSAYGQCSESCHSNTNINNPPQQSRTRQCLGATGAGNCNGAVLFQTQSCQVQTPCPGTWGQWGSYGVCSETCQSNGSVPPFQTRTRVCVKGTWNGDCPTGETTQSGSCNAAVPCPGTLTQWSAYGACSASCQLGLSAPTYSRTRQCAGNTFGGNCNGGALTQVSDCNVEVSCPGELSNWGQWSTCSETCQSSVTNPPTKGRSRTCTNFSFGGNCGNQALSETTFCNSQVACPGSYGSWGSFGQCSESCQSNTNVAPTQTRTRVCIGGTFGGGCTGPSSETINCNAAVPCQGTLTQWSAYGACSATCQLGLTAPTYSRTRQCVGNTFGGNCNGGALTQVSDCNLEVTCPGELTQWSDWGNCPETCQTGAQPSVLSRARQCINKSYGGNCAAATLSETKTCSANVPCPGILSQWQSWGACSASCQLGSTSPTRNRVRTCTGATFGANCGGVAFREDVSCNVQVGCPGTLTLWGEWTTCSETCQSNQNMAPSKARMRLCANSSFNGNCFNATLEEKVTCNALVICPRPGSWMAWQAWSDCSQTCNLGVQQRNRTCTMGFPATAGDDCTPGDGRQTRVCNLGNCPVECPVTKRCNCSLAAQFGSSPDLSYFQVTDGEIDQVVALVNYWTPEIKNQLCESCSIPRLTSSLTTINSQMEQVVNMRTRLDNIKRQLRNIINCNNNVYIGADLWKVYDYLWVRITMLNGINTEYMSMQMKFQAAVESCNKYDIYLSPKRSSYQYRIMPKPIYAMDPSLYKTDVPEMVNVEEGQNEVNIESLQSTFVKCRST